MPSLSPLVPSPLHGGWGLCYRSHEGTITQAIGGTGICEGKLVESHNVLYFNKILLTISGNLLSVQCSVVSSVDQVPV